MRYGISRFAACKVRPVTADDEADWRSLWQSYYDFYSVAIPSEVTDTLWRRIMDRGDRIGPVQGRLDDLVPVLPDDVEEDVVALCAVRLGDELAGPEDLAAGVG